MAAMWNSAGHYIFILWFLLLSFFFLSFFPRLISAVADAKMTQKIANISSIGPHNMLNFCPLTAEIFRRVWGTPANFNGFRVLASLLQRRRSTEANQTLHDVSPSPVLLHYIYIFRGSCPDGILPGAKINSYGTSVKNTTSTTPSLSYSPD